MSKPGTELLRTGFGTLSGAEGWVYAPDAGTPPSGEWVECEGHGCITATGGGWRSPSFPSTPFEYSELRVQVRAEGPCFWMADFFEPDGTQLIADHYSMLDASEGWSEQRFFFRGRGSAATARVGFRPIGGKRVWIAGVEVRAAARGDAARWADEIYAGLPPVPFAPAAERWTHLSRTRAAFRRGDALSVVMLGDSAINDLANAAIDVRIERHYPGLRLNVVQSVAGSVGGWYYREQNRVESAVLAHRPDLLIIGGISNCLKLSPEEGVEALRDVIRQVRARQDPEIVLMTGAVGKGDARNEPGWMESASASGTDYRSRLMALAEDERAGYLDLEGAWGNYLRALTMPREFFLRDPYHANERGRQALAVVVERFFGPG